MSQRGRAGIFQQVPAVSWTSALHSPKNQGRLGLSKNHKQVLKVSARGLKRRDWCLEGETENKELGKCCTFPFGLS